MERVMSMERIDFQLTGVTTRISES